VPADLRAGAFGSEAEAYERGRPGYPPEVAAVGGLPPSARVLDLGSGTGKLTRVLRGRFADVVAVEPDARMRRLDPGALAGSAEAIPLPDGSVDGVFVGEAFHWFDTPETVAEVARVLRPGGTLALLWNVALEHLVPDDVWDGPPSGQKRNRFETGEWRAAFAGSPFGAFEQASVDHEQTLTRAELVDYYASISWVAALPQAERRARIERFAAGLDRDGYRRPLRAEVHWARRA
jgi:SAM-dependent methyltransferase